MMVLPSQTAANDFSHQRIETLLASCPPLKAVVSARGSGPRVEGASTITFKTFAGGFLKLTGTLSASELSQVAVRDLYMTEVDRYAIETENKEGSPVHLAKLRQRTFEHTSKLIMECSPTISGESRIELEYQAGTPEHYFLPCPLCGHQQELLKPGFDWESVTYRCVNCAQPSLQRAWLSRVGSWRSCRENGNGDIDGTIPVRSFWVPAWISELVSWQRIGEDYARAKELLEVGDKSLLKTLVQTSFAECWVEEQRPPIRGGELLSRAEEYRTEIPDEVLVLVAAIDTQDTCLKFLVSGVGLGKELWFLEFGRIDGSLERDAPSMYTELEERVLKRAFRCADEKIMRVRRACQDAGGHHASVVYEHVKKYPQILWGFRAVESRPGTPIWKKGRSANENIPILLGATTLAKDLLLNRLEIPAEGAGFIHIGDANHGFDESWAKEMTAERKQVVFRGGIQKTIWRRIGKSHTPNDALDLACMTLVLVESLKLRFDEKTVPDYYEPKQNTVEVDGKNGQPTRPTWGAQPGSGVLLDGMPIGPKVPVGSVPQPQDKPRLRFGVQNVPLQW